MTATPIFVLGRHRSGTTWLSNVLAELADVYSTCYETHLGVHESAFFSHLVPYCNHGRTEPDLRAIKCLFEQSQFFSLTGLEEGPEIVGQGPVAYFRSIMEAGAKSKGARFWLEKTPAHTLHAKFLSKAFPDAKFIAIIRDYRDVVASNVHAFANAKSPWLWFWHSVVTAVYEKIVRRNVALIINYESLVGDYDRTVLSIMRELGTASEIVPRSRFRRNTFYREAVPAREWWQSLAMSLGRWGVLPLPAALVEFQVIRLQRRRPGFLPNWFFRAPIDSVGDPR